jgi:HD-GYP domain-containing protein (c-di-GMP phosphodiesterase class II)
MEKAVEEIVQGRGKLFDPSIVDAFLRCQPRIESCIAWKKNANTAGCPTRPPSAKPGPA